MSRERAALFGAVGNARVARGEKFLLLQLDAFPRRITEHDIETASRKYFGKFQRPMKERLADTRAPRRCHEAARQWACRRGGRRARRT